MFLWQELSQVKAAALTERGQAEEELIKVRNQARLEEVRTRPVYGPCLCGREWIWLPSLCFCLRELLSNSPRWVSLACK